MPTSAIREPSGDNAAADVLMKASTPSGRLRWRRTGSGLTTEARPRAPMASHAMPPASSAARIHGAPAIHAGLDFEGGRNPTFGSAIASRISMRASPMSRSLCAGSFWRQRRSTKRSSPGTSDGNAFQSGSFFMTAASTSVTVSPENARFPVSIS